MEKITVNDLTKYSNDIVKESYYKGTLKNGLDVVIFPKKELDNTYVMWATKYGSNDSKFINPRTKEKIEVPDGVAHFLEHKMFEQKNGTNSLDTLTALGVNANAYTCGTHTAYLFDGMSNISDALKELMDYVQNPYFTDENVEKEKGIIAQEIGMYDDNNFWVCYHNLMCAMYHNLPLKIDTAGTKETISKIDKDILYNCYETFYSPKNMVMIVVGNLDLEKTLDEIQENITDNYCHRDYDRVERIKFEEPDNIVEKEVEKKMDISIPLILTGIKLKPNKEIGQDKIKRELAINIINEILIGKTSELFNRLYNEGKILGVPGKDYDFYEDYSYILFDFITKEDKYVVEQFVKKIEELKEKGISEKEFQKVKKSIFGSNILAFESAGRIARILVNCEINDIDIFEYIDNLNNLNLDDVNEVLQRDYMTDKIAISKIYPKK